MDIKGITRKLMLIKHWNPVYRQDSFENSVWIILKTNLPTVDIKNASFSLRPYFNYTFYFI